MDVERRSLLRGLAVGLTGVAVTPTPSGAHAHASATSLSDAQPAAPPTIPAPTPSALDAHQRATLESLAELILPGAVTAGAVERIDRVAAVDAPAAQRRLLNAIARFDQEARETAGARWLDLSDTARLELLTRAAEGATGQQPQPAWTRGQPVVSPTVVSAPPTTLHDHLDLLKAVIGGAYASTEAGMTALGWTGRSSWRELPGCTHDDPAHD